VHSLEDAIKLWSKYQASIENAISRLLSFSAEKEESFQQKNIDIDSIANTISYLDSLLGVAAKNALLSKDIRQIQKVAQNIWQELTERYKSNDFRLMESVRKAVYSMYDYIDFINRSSPNYKPFDENAAKNYISEMLAETQKNMEKISIDIKNIISAIKDWRGSNVIVTAREYDSQNELAAETDAEITVGDSGATFAYFVTNEGIIIDDVLEGGDPEFFSDPKIQSDYFNLIKEIRNPGSSSKGGKILTLYTARPAKDRDKYLNNRSIPSNIFLTNKLDSAEGIGADFGDRDIWMVKIDSRYLINTLDSPMEKQYQVVGDNEVPVIDMRLIKASGKTPWFQHSEYVKDILEIKDDSQISLEDF
jgi:hypothetical protein